jgi:hypothetical protein
MTKGRLGARDKMPVSVTELREQARLLEVELTRLTALSDSIDTRAGVVIGIAAVLTGLLLQATHPTPRLRDAAIVALASAIAGVLTAFPRRMQSPDPAIVADLYDLYERLPEADATGILSRERLRDIGVNKSIAESKRLLLTLAVVILVVAIVMSALAVRTGS